MKYLAAIAALLYTTSVTPESQFNEWWQVMYLGAPCSTATDRHEGTCNLKVRRRPTWE